eukprot:10965773-Heterocapsa_arctica.AAC.1
MQKSDGVKGQNDINYITGENFVQASSSPLSEMIRKKSLKGSLAVDLVDECAAQQLKEYDGKKLMPIMKEGLDNEDEDEKIKLEELK